MFSAQLALLPAGLAAVDQSAVLHDDKWPAANSCASSEAGRVGPLIKASGYCKARMEVALGFCVSGTPSVTRAIATRETLSYNSYQQGLLQI